MREAAAVLQWYVDMGADEALDESPRDYFAASIPSLAPQADIQELRIGNREPQAVAVAQATPRPLINTHPVASSAISFSQAAALAEARRLADGADSLAALEEAVRGFDGCAIKKTATHTVFADGNPAARLMLIGEAPGAQEDIQGIPFCGPSGQLLDKMFAAIGYDRTRFYITNTLFWRPPGNRQPNAEELAICRPFVEKHIALIDPQLIVLVGGTATKAVLGTELGITRLRGKTYTFRSTYRDKDYPVAIVYHPSYLLRQPAQKRATWQDLLAIKAQMEGLSG